MNPIDLLVLVLVVGGGFLGWVNGVVKWLFTFLGFVGLRQFITFALIVVAVSLGAWMLGRTVKMTLSMLMLGWVDRGAGMAVGLLVGLLGASAVALAVNALPVDEVRQAVDESLLAETLLDATALLRELMPPEFEIETSLFTQAGRR